MPEYLSPGDYIAEIERRPKPIEGVATSTAAFLGETQRGPLTPTLVTSYSDYLRRFGDVFDPNKFMPYTVKMFFDNGGRRCYVTRIVGGDDPVFAAATLAGLTVTAVGPGKECSKVWVRVRAGSTRIMDGSPIGFRLQVYYWADPQDVPGDGTGIDTARIPTLVEDFNDLSVDPTSTSYFANRVNNGNSALASWPRAIPPRGCRCPRRTQIRLTRACPTRATTPR